MTAPERRERGRDGDGRVRIASDGLAIARQEAPEIRVPVPDADAQTADAREFLAAVRAGAGLFLPWGDLAELVDVLLPGWLFVVGARAKGGKSTFLLNLAMAWIEYSRRVLYVGTEQPAAQLRILLAAVLSGNDYEAAVKGRLAAEAEERFQAALTRLAASPCRDRLVLADAPGGTLEELEQLVVYATEARCDVLVFDHLHRLDTGDGEAAWTGFGGAVRRIKNLARDAGMLIAAAAQLKYGEGSGLLSEYEGPGASSWYGGIRIQQEADVALQVWRPMRIGVSEAEKKAARVQGTLTPLVRQYRKGEPPREYVAQPLVEPNIMAVRIAAHRYKNDAMGEVRRLYVRRGTLETISAREPQLTLGA
jgi:hypothetical protein